MDIRPIRNDADHLAALKGIQALWNASPGSSEADKLDILATLVEAYESRHFPLPDSDPVDFLKAHMEATGRTQSDLAALFGSRARASEILNRRRSLTVDMIHKLATGWGVPADALVKPYQIEHAA